MLKTFTLYKQVFGLKGAVSATVARMQRKPCLLPIDPKHTIHPLFLRLPSSDVLTFREVFTRRTYDIQFPIPPKSIVDAGANIGLTSVFLAQKFPDARIIAIEPDPGNFRLLKKNCDPYPNIHCVEAALWGSECEVEVVDEGRGEWGYTTRPIPNDINTNRSKSLTITVPRLLELFQINTIDFFKMDIEGAERDVFSSHTDWVKAVQIMAIELHERFAPGSNRAFYNATNGFSIEQQNGDTVWLSRHSNVVFPPS